MQRMKANQLLVRSNRLFLQNTQVAVLRLVCQASTKSTFASNHSLIEDRT